MTRANAHPILFSAVDSPLREPSAVAELTARLALGEEAAFREFHAAYFAPLSRYVLVLMRGDEAAARDVTQETLLRVVRYVKRFAEEGVFWDWLARLARTAAADHGRKSSRYRRLLALFAWQQPREMAPPGDNTIAQALASALAAIPADEQALLAKKYDQHTSVRDIAAASGLSETAVESRLARIRRALRDAVFALLRHEK